MVGGLGVATRSVGVSGQYGLRRRDSSGEASRSTIEKGVVKEAKAGTLCVMFGAALGRHGNRQGADVGSRGC